MTRQPQPAEGCGAPNGSSALLTVPQTDGTCDITNDQRHIIDEINQLSGRERGWFVTVLWAVPAKDVMVFSTTRLRTAGSSVPSRASEAGDEATHKVILCALAVVDQAGENTRRVTAVFTPSRRSTYLALASLTRMRGLARSSLSR